MLSHCQGWMKIRLPVQSDSAHRFLCFTHAYQIWYILNERNAVGEDGLHKECHMPNGPSLHNLKPHAFLVWHNFAIHAPVHQFIACRYAMSSQINVLFTTKGFLHSSKSPFPPSAAPVHIVLKLYNPHILLYKQSRKLRSNVPPSQGNKNNQKTSRSFFPFGGGSIKKAFQKSISQFYRQMAASIH